MNNYDAIVIGSGIGGLVSAGILTAHGMKTLVVEKHTSPGGYLSSFKRKGFTFDSAVDCISGVQPGGIIYEVLKSLDADGLPEFIRLDPIRVSIFPDMSAKVDADIAAYIERLIELFPSERSAVGGFFSKMDEVYDTVNAIMSADQGFNKMTPEVLRFINCSYQELLDEYFQDYRLKALLSDRCPFIGLPPSGVSAITMTNMLMSYFKAGAFRVGGGFQRLSDVFAGAIRNKGGEIILGNGVRRILVNDDGSCHGIICENGEEYTARYIISNADFHHTFCNLLSGKYSAYADEMVRARGITISFFIVYAGTRGSAAAHSSTGYFPSYDMESFFRPEMEFREDSTIGMTAATVEDKSLAPEGCSTVALHEMVASSGREHDKAACTEMVLKKAERIIPDLRESIMVIDAATPATLRRYTGNYNGAAFGWKQSPGLRGMKKHGISNLYIAGHWGDMGGGVLAAAYSGAKAAGDVLARVGVKIVP